MTRTANSATPGAALFAQQLASATNETGDVDLTALGEIIAKTYEVTARDQRRIQESLDELQQRLNDAFEVLPEGIVLFDAEDRLLFWNRRYAEMFGSSADLLAVGRRFEDVLRIALERGEFLEAVGREEDWLAERLARHRAPSST